MIYTWLVMLRTRWAQMSPSEQISATWNAMADAFLLLFFLYGTWLGLTSKPDTLVVVVPALGVGLFFRYKQLRKRWKL